MRPYGLLAAYRSSPVNRSAQTTAVLDQLDAANNHARRCFDALREKIGSERDATPSTGAQVVALRFTERAGRGQISLCQHLSVTAPNPAFWTPWAPGRIRCSACSAQSAQRIKGTPEDRRCDSCQHDSGGSIYQNAVLIPAASLKLPELIAIQLPIVIIFGLCPSCQRVNNGNTTHAA